MVGPSTDELCITVHPTNQKLFLSASNDKRVCLWDASSHSLVWKKDVNEAISSACFTTDGPSVILGSTSGKWLVSGRLKFLFSLNYLSITMSLLIL